MLAKMLIHRGSRKEKDSPEIFCCGGKKIKKKKKGGIGTTSGTKRVTSHHGAQRVQ